ncbi:hypothetical protein, partial [Proteiniclasticum ruminis]|uniref:hypothetical protein n=1 Tax=Proteiniclasticum ruminis TaxID=398199 RepID=UPI0028A2B656
TGVSSPKNPIALAVGVSRNTNCTFEGFSSEDMNILWGNEDFHSIISEIKEICYDLGALQ